MLSRGFKIKVLVASDHQNFTREVFPQCSGAGIKFTLLFPHSLPFLLCCRFLCPLSKKTFRERGDERK